MIVGIHQPNFLPWIGYFYKISQSDVFVLLDNVQFTKNSYQNRVKIKTPQGETWLTVPVVHSFGQLTSEVRISSSADWRSKHLKTLELNYKKAPHFQELFPIIEAAYLRENWELLEPFCSHLIGEITSYLQIETKLIKASSLSVTGNSTELLIDIIKSVSGKTYISGTGGSKYQDESLFETEGIDLQYSSFKHPVYSQLWGDFCRGLSVIDLLFNEGPVAFARCKEA